MTRLAVDGTSPVDDVVAAVERWVAEAVPAPWRAAAAEGPDALRRVRSRAEYESWYPTFADAGLVVPTWAPEHGGLGLGGEAARSVDGVLAPYRLHRLNPLGLHNAAAALFAHGTEEQRRRFLPPMVRNEQVWCQLFSEPGAGSDLASLACRAERDGDHWVVQGQKVWTTWADRADFAILLARTDPEAPKHRGITYFVLDLHQPQVDIRPLRQLTGDCEFNEVWIDGAVVPDADRIGDVGDGWKVSASTLSSERAMVSGGGGGAGSGRLGGISAEDALSLAQRLGRSADPLVRQHLAAMWGEERIRAWTNARSRQRGGAGVASIGKVHQADLNQRLQLLVTDLLGTEATAWEATSGDYAEALHPLVRGMLRSRANSIEGGTTEVNKNILAERVLGLPREPDPWHGRPWREVPRS